MTNDQNIETRAEIDPKARENILVKLIIDGTIGREQLSREQLINIVMALDEHITEIPQDYKEFGIQIRRYTFEEANGIVDKIVNFPRVQPASLHSITFYQYLPEPEKEYSD